MLHRLVRPVVLCLACLALFVSPVLSPQGSVIEAATTISSVATGKWTDPAIWNLKRIPAKGDAVVISAGTTVTYDRFSDDEMASVTINGKLVFSRTTGTRLDSGNVIIESAGHLDMGTSASPIPANIDAEIRLVTSATPTCIGGSAFDARDVGLWVMPGGRWDIYGAPLRHTWGKLIEDVSAGSAVVKVRENVTDWPVGGSVLVTATGLGYAAAEYEVRQIASVAYSTDHTRITLTPSLSFGHKGSVPVAGEVALLSRNVSVSTKYAYPTLGHTVYMHTAAGSIGYAEFRDLGNFGCLGRYPIHFHMMDNASRGMAVRGASIWRSQNHFLNIHASAGLLVEDTVGFDAVGLGYVIGEPATGMSSPENVFLHNLAAKVYEKTGGLQIDNKTSGFWIGNRNSVLIDNVASGSTQQYKLDSGFFIWGEPAEFDATRRPLVLVRNEAHSNGSNGWFSWSNGQEFFVMLDFRSWRNGANGLLWGAYSTRFQIHRALVFENGQINVSSLVVRAHLQDSVLYGTSTVATPLGFRIGSYNVPNDPATPVKLLRNSFGGHKTDFSQDHTPCAAGAAEEQNPRSRDCSAAYVMAVGNSFKAIPAIDFGWHANASSWLEVRAWTGAATPAITASNFRLTRKDQPQPDTDAYYYAPFDSWLNPITVAAVSASSGALGSAAGSGSGTAAAAPRPRRTPTPAPTGGSFVPPTIAFVTPKEGELLGSSTSLEVTAAGPSAITRVDFFADEVLLGSVTAAPYRFTWSSASWVRKRAYVYACATDASGMIACTPVLKLNRTAP